MFKTTAAYLSGAICGDLWQPGIKAGKPINVDLRRAFKRIDLLEVAFRPAMFLEVLDLILCEEGGDFRNAAFTPDTIIRIERRRIDGPSRYTMHVKEITLDRVGCADLVGDDYLACDFFGED